MITVEEAFSIVMENCPSAEIEEVNIDEAQGRVLAEGIFADRNFPPFDRVTMDGIAIKFEKFNKGHRSFLISDIAPAGSEQKKLNDQSSCIEVMTGAMLPEGADTVIRYEDLKIADNHAEIMVHEVKFRQNIHFEGIDRKKGSSILQKGITIGPAELGVLATVGKYQINVFKNPKIAIVSSGDELVDINEIPAPYQIRKSNNYSITGALTPFKCKINCFHLLDEPEIIKIKLQEIINEHDVIVLSGGVSMGKFDYIPEALTLLGVEKLFHKVKQRPGKPFWFGKNDLGKVVFALPGNPVSSFMCTQKYILPWMRKHLNSETQSRYAILDTTIHFKPDLNYYAQVKLNYNPSGKIIATPIEGNGSGDLANLSDADAFIELTQGQDIYERGIAYPIIVYRN